MASPRREEYAFWNTGSSYALFSRARAPGVKNPQGLIFEVDQTRARATLGQILSAKYTPEPLFGFTRLAERLHDPLRRTGAAENK